MYKPELPAVPAVPPDDVNVMAPKPRTCKLCTIELAQGEVHLSHHHCVRILAERIKFLRQITLNQARELDWERTAIKATHRMAYIILDNLAEGRKITLGREKFENIPDGAGITLAELENGDFEVVGVLPAPPKADKVPS